MTLLTRRLLLEDSSEEDVIFVEPSEEEDVATIEIPVESPHTAWSEGTIVGRQLADLHIGRIGIGVMSPRPSETGICAPHWGAPSESVSARFMSELEDQSGFEIGEFVGRVRTWLTLGISRKLELEEELVVRYGQFETVSSIHLLDSLDGVKVYVSLDQVEYDDGLMDQLLDQEWAISDQFRDSDLEVFYFPLPRGDVPPPIPDTATRILD